MRIFYFSLLLFLFNHFFSLAAPGDTTRLRVHDAVDMVWYENYDRPVVFPNTTTTYSKILMHYTMGCASTGCSDWDYTTKIELLKPTGVMDSTVASVDTVSSSPLVVDTTWNVFEVKEAFELARVITPYGGYMRTSQQGYNPSWKHVHTFDVTDYAPLLVGTNEMRAFYGGWSSGFSVTIDFEFIEGTPPREVLAVKNLWQTGGNGWNYQNTSDFEQNFLKALDVAIPADMVHAKLRFIPSGHGFDNNTSCAEFCQRNYKFKLDGTQLDSRLMWDDKCGVNPIFPQGGTWLYDRANWCPGLRAHAFDYEFSNQLTAGATHQFDIDIDPIYWSGTQAPVYILETQLFIYGAKSFQVDAAIEDIISPTDKDDYKRDNPICKTARVKIKNNGSNNLTTATIKYAVNGNHWRTYNWTGNLAFDATEIVELPITEVWEWSGATGNSSIFEVKIENPNGQVDENAVNNHMQSKFQNTPMIASHTEFSFRTNNKPAETTWKLYDANGTVLHQNIPNMAANTLYKDTFNLEPGCYMFKLEDSQKNGLSFWANNDGAGLARLRIVGGNFIKTFPLDFGTELVYYFTVGHALDVANVQLDEVSDLQLFPNPSKGLFHLNYISNDREDVTIEVKNQLGQLVFFKDSVSNSTGNLEYVIDLNAEKSGVYFVTVHSKSTVMTRKITKN